MNIAMTGIFVKDTEEAFIIYTEKIGFVEVMHDPASNLAIVAADDAPDGTALLLEPSSNPLAKEYREGLYTAGIPAIVFGSKDINADYERLKKNGIKFKNDPLKTPYGMTAMFDDGCGNWIQIHQASEG
ncbi:MAG: VOC family protein [Candidatus Kapaibacterium sp.]